MKALIVTHHPEEGPGLLENILRERGWEITEVGLWNEDSIPDPTPFHLLILMGGPMSVNDDALHPFLEQEKQFVRQWINAGNPTVGICLGAQLIAHCLGGRVYKGPKEEIGWYDLVLTEEGRRDPCLQLFPMRFPVFQWHGETFDLPQNAILLATAQDYPHQAFRFGDLTYAFQFHVEVTKEMVKEWLGASEVNEVKQQEITSSLPIHLPVVHQLCRNVMQPLLDSVERLIGTRGKEILPAREVQQ
jgi:GMP synthase-like glutamine amidotransferase